MIGRTDLLSPQPPEERWSRGCRGGAAGVAHCSACLCSTRTRQLKAGGPTYTNRTLLACSKLKYIYFYSVSERFTTSEGNFQKKMQNGIKQLLTCSFELYFDRK